MCVVVGDFYSLVVGFICCCRCFCLFIVCLFVLLHFDTVIIQKKAFKIGSHTFHLQ